MSRLSIIIPTLGNWDALEASLVSVLQNRPPRSEVIVVLNQTYGDPYDLREEIRFVEASTSARLVDLVNAGFAAARSELVHVLACGATVRDGWTDTALRHFDDPKVAAVAPLVLDATNPARVLTAGCTWSPGGSRTSYAAGLAADDVSTSNGNWIGPELAAGFYRRSALAEVSALDTTLLPELAAVDLGLQLLHSGRRAVLDAACRVALAPQWVSAGRELIQAWHSERVFWRYAGCHGWLRGLAAHGLLVSAETLRHVARPSGIARTVGRMLGACDRRKARRTDLSRAATPHARPAHDVDRRIDPAHETCSPEHSAPACRRFVSLSSGEEPS